jgi:hypothetical protein
LSLAKVVTAKIHVDTMTRWLEGNIGEYTGDGNVTARRKSEGVWSMELLSAVSVLLVPFTETCSK